MTPNFQDILHAKNVKGILERQWSRKKIYVMRGKQLENSPRNQEPSSKVERGC